MATPTIPTLEQLLASQTELAGFEEKVARLAKDIDGMKRRQVRYDAELVAKRAAVEEMKKAFAPAAPAAAKK